MIAFTQKLADPFVGIVDLVRRFSRTSFVPASAQTGLEGLDARMLADIGADRCKMAIALSRHRR